MLKDSTTVWLVDYYAPWCPHCREFAPKWEQIANFYANSDKVNVGAVDCTKYKEICNQENVYGYPGVKLHHVPADAEKAHTMASGIRGTKPVIQWVEKLMEEHGVKSGVDMEDLAAQLTNFRKDDVVGIDGEEGMVIHSDQSLDVKYKRLHDAGIATFSTFQSGFFTGTNVLEGERYKVALLWMETLAISFPIETNRQVLTKLAEVMKTSSHWNYADWKVALNGWKELTSNTTFPVNLFASSEEKPWKFCKTYTCGMWTLFHSITVNEVKVSKESSSEPWKPSKIAAAIWLYVKNFFGCEECREHFLQSNPKSVIDELALNDANGSHAVIMWLWKMHNTVNKVVENVQWPSKRACPVCYVDNGEPLSLDPVRLHENEIVSYVISAYGYDEEEIYAMDVVHNGKTVTVQWSWMQRFTAMIMVLGLTALLGMAYKTKKYRTFDHKTFLMRDHIA
ncbi:unnamed protein product [Peronospora belbahrii]|nr:unnamed protein product [Peronospora belbahrii]